MHSQFFAWLLFSCFCLSVGSFINVVIYRLPQQIMRPDATLTLCFPRSHCPCCKATVRFIDNIPLVSWVLLGGQCRDCQNRISWRYPLTELITLLVSLLLASCFPLNMPLLALLLLTWFLYPLALIDAQHQLLPDALTLPLLWLGLLLQTVGWLPGTDAAAGITGAICGYGVLRLLAAVYYALKSSEGLGRGDAKLLAALGAWLGWQPLPMLLLIAACAALVGIIFARILTRRELNHPYPFGPWLAAAGWVLFIYQIHST